MRIVRRLSVTAFVASFAVVAFAQSTQPVTQRLLKAGTLIKVDGARLVIQPLWQPSDAAPITVETDQRTRVILDNERSALDKLQAGMDLSARREASTDREPNPRLIVHAWSPSSTGLISEVEGAAIHLTKTPSGTEPVSPIVQTDKETKIIRVASLVGDTWDEGGPMKLDELKADMLVKAMPPKGVASRIFVWPARIPPQATTAPTKTR
ncbi:MAG: hypothetical protein WBD40_03890 [Tepidisphaeraceae bacterium]